MLQLDDPVLFLDVEMEIISLKGSDICEWVVSNPHKRLFRGGFLNLLLCLFYIFLLFYFSITNSVMGVARRFTVFHRDYKTSLVQAIYEKEL